MDTSFLFYKKKRSIGSDITKGQCVLKCGSKLGYSQLGILATVGETKIKVYQQPVVCLLSTGNEVNNSNNISFAQM